MADPELLRRDGTTRSVEGGEEPEIARRIGPHRYDAHEAGEARGHREEAPVLPAVVRPPDFLGRGREPDLRRGEAGSPGMIITPLWGYFPKRVVGSCWGRRAPPRSRPAELMIRVPRRRTTASCMLPPSPCPHRRIKASQPNTRGRWVPSLIGEPPAGGFVAGRKQVLAGAGGATAVDGVRTRALRSGDGPGYRDVPPIFVYRQESRPRPTANALADSSCPCW